MSYPMRAGGREGVEGEGERVGGWEGGREGEGEGRREGGKQDFVDTQHVIKTC